MALFRYLYGVASISGMVNKNLVFKGDSQTKYFSKIREYFIARSGQGRYEKWNNIYGMDNFIKSLNNQNNTTNNIQRYNISNNLRLPLYNCL
jgi:hypothetical protein